MTQAHIRTRPAKDADAYAITWPPIVTLVTSLVLLLGTMWIGALAIGVVVGIMGLSEDQANTLLQDSVALQFVYAVAVEASALGLLWAFLRHYKTSFQAIGLRRPRWGDLGYALVGYGMYLPLTFMAVAVAKLAVPGLDVEQAQQLGYGEVQGLVPLLIVFLTLVILPPITEEILCRGFLYTGLRARWPKLAAILATSIIFGVLHLQFGSDAPLLWVAAIDTFVFSLVLIFVREVSGGLIASMGTHMLKNGIAFLVLFILHAA